MMQRLCSCYGHLIGSVTAALIIIMVVFCSGRSVSATETAPLPPERHEYTNVIMISVDILRADHLGAYGYRKGTSPQIDKLAGQSVLFENSIAHSYLTPVA